MPWQTILYRGRVPNHRFLKSLGNFVTKYKIKLLLKSKGLTQKAVERQLLNKGKISWDPLVIGQPKVYLSIECLICNLKLSLCVGEIRILLVAYHIFSELLLLLLYCLIQFCFHWLINWSIGLMENEKGSSFHIW